MISLMFWLQRMCHAELFEHLSEVDFEEESLYQTFHKEGRDITSIQRKLDVILAD